MEFLSCSKGSGARNRWTTAILNDDAEMREVLDIPAGVTHCIITVAFSKVEISPLFLDGKPKKSLISTVGAGRGKAAMTKSRAKSAKAPGSQSK